MTLLTCAVISTSQDYIREIGDKYKLQCTAPQTTQYSFEDQLACFCFNFHLPDEVSESIEPENEMETPASRVILYHAWCRSLEKRCKGSATNFTVRLPKKVHKYCRVYAVAVRFKDPASWLQFIRIEEDNYRRGRQADFYSCCELLTPEDGQCGEGETLSAVVVGLTEDGYQRDRLDLYTDASVAFSA